MTTNTDQQVAQSETLEQIADDLPYRIVEEMGLGLTFRSCTCGQLPCARLRPLRDALEAVRRAERERAIRIINDHQALDKCEDNCWTTRGIASSVARWWLIVVISVSVAGIVVNAGVTKMPSDRGPCEDCGFLTPFRLCWKCVVARYQRRKQ